MNRGRAETHLRQLAEAELRRATEPGALSLGPAGTLPLVAQVLIAVGAVDVGTADGTPWIDLVAAGPSAQVQAGLPLRWTWNP